MESIPTRCTLENGTAKAKSPCRQVRARRRLGPLEEVWNAGHQGGFLLGDDVKVVINLEAAKKKI